MNGERGMSPAIVLVHFWVVYFAFGVPSGGILQLRCNFWVVNNGFGVVLGGMR